MHSIRAMRSHRGTKIALSAVVLLTAAGLLLWDSDFLLALQLKMNRHDRPSYPTQLTKAKPLHSKVVGDRLVADSVSIDARIYGGSNSSKGLAKGVWIDPHGSTPGAGEPVIIAGHRTTRHFATLHMLKRGQPVIVYWKGREYDYIVTKVKSLKSSSGINVQRDAPGSGERLIMYTCEKWKGDRRHAVIAVPYKRK